MKPRHAVVIESVPGGFGPFMPVLYFLADYSRGSVGCFLLLQFILFLLKISRHRLMMTAVMTPSPAPAPCSACSHQLILKLNGGSSGNMYSFHERNAHIPQEIIVPSRTGARISFLAGDLFPDGDGTRIP